MTSLVDLFKKAKSMARIEILQFLDAVSIVKLSATCRSMRQIIDSENSDHFVEILERQGCTDKLFRYSNQNDQEIARAYPSSLKDLGQVYLRMRMLKLLSDPSADKNITYFEEQEEQNGENVEPIMMLPNSGKIQQEISTWIAEGPQDKFKSAIFDLQKKIKGEVNGRQVFVWRPKVEYRKFLTLNGIQLQQDSPADKDFKRCLSILVRSGENNPAYITGIARVYNYRFREKKVKSRLDLMAQHHIDQLRPQTTQEEQRIRQSAAFYKDVRQSQQLYYEQDEGNSLEKTYKKKYGVYFDTHVHKIAWVQECNIINGQIDWVSRFKNLQI